jgi:hypothetical protein
MRWQFSLGVGILLLGLLGPNAVAMRMKGVLPHTTGDYPSIVINKRFA